MKQALKEAALKSCVEGVPIGTLRALVKRELCGTDGRLNPFGCFVALSLIPLDQQCCALGLKLEDRKHSWDGPPEPAALDLLIGDNQWGFADEGRMLHALIHAIVLPRLYATAAAAWNKKAGYDVARSWLYAHYAGYNDILDLDPDLATKMLYDIQSWDRSAFVKSWRILRDWNVDNDWYPHPASRIEPDLALAILDAVGVQRLAAIAASVFTDPYTYYHGWPDLMVMDPTGNLRFVEVKTTDRLHYGQIITMSDMKAAAGLQIDVLRLKRQK